jgi:hypothetical protein
MCHGGMLTATQHRSMWRAGQEPQGYLYLTTTKRRRGGGIAARTPGFDGVRIRQQEPSNIIAISCFWTGAHPEHPINIIKMISITQSNVVGTVQGEVFALSSALSLHQALEFHQCVACSWFSAHRPCGAFPTLFPRRVWVFQPWQTSFQAISLQIIAISLSVTGCSNRQRT